MKLGDKVVYLERPNEVYIVHNLVSFGTDKDIQCVNEKNKAIIYNLPKIKLIAYPLTRLQKVIYGVN